MDTAHAHPDDPQPLGASLRRSSGDRILLGLCAGIARSTNISPLAMRLGTVLVSFILLPFVLLAYTVTAVLVPRDDGAALIGTGWRDRRDVWIALGLTLLAAPVALGAGSAGGWRCLSTDRWVRWREALRCMDEAGLISPPDGARLGGAEWGGVLRRAGAAARNFGLAPGWRWAR